ncbi:hypothetical protein KW445_07225 [Vibrio fluvialis]|nr:hypothetical protein [Vibrio fluvialis]
MTNYSAYISFNSITMSGLVLASGISKWISGLLLNAEFIFIIAFLSLFLFIVFLTTNQNRLILKKDSTFRIIITIYYFFVIFTTSVILCFFPSYYLSVFILIIPAAIMVVKRMILSYERLTGEKVE